jgi:hypothetical protein
MVQDLSRRPLNAEARVQNQTSQCGIVVDIRTAGQCFSEYFFCARQHHPTDTPHIHSSITNATRQFTAS